ncbi:MAG: hypothetical protein JNK87_28275 [Bryobacterales bacterium]|nr:hypothetical protein [Bryobacterales bacterium]
MSVVTIPDGSRSTVQGKPSANRLLQHLKTLNQMIADKHSELRTLEIEERSTPVDQVSPLLLARKAAAWREIHRLSDGRKYWEKQFNEEVSRLKQAGANEKALPTDEPPERERRITPQDLRGGGQLPPQPYFKELPTTPGPGKCIVGPPGAKLTKEQRDGLILEQWNQYWRRLDSAREDYERELEVFAVNQFFWQERQRKTLAAGKPFTEAPPVRPEFPDIPAPACPPPFTAPA